MDTGYPALFPDLLSFDKKGEKPRAFSMAEFSDLPQQVEEGDLDGKEEERSPS